MNESTEHFLEFECIAISGQIVKVKAALGKDNNITKITTAEKDKQGEPFIPTEKDMSMFEMYTVLMTSQVQGIDHEASSLPSSS